MPFYAIALHRAMQYISIGGCSIYPTADAVYITFSYVQSVHA